MPAKLRVTLRKSPISYTAKTRGTVRALGLRRIGQTVEVADNPQTRGMARAIRFLVEVEEAQGAAAERSSARARSGRTGASTDGESRTRESTRAPQREGEAPVRRARGEEGE
jgi:large subunit ribosomal protein L30